MEYFKFNDNEITNLQHMKPSLEEILHSKLSSYDLHVQRNYIKTFLVFSFNSEAIHLFAVCTNHISKQEDERALICFRHCIASILFFLLLLLALKRSCCAYSMKLFFRIEWILMQGWGRGLME